MRWTRDHGGQWYRWFAWYPIVLRCEWTPNVGYERVWWEWVERKTQRIGPYTYHQYRQLPDDKRATEAGGHP